MQNSISKGRMIAVMSLGEVHMFRKHIENIETQLDALKKHLKAAEFHNRYTERVGNENTERLETEVGEYRSAIREIKEIEEYIRYNLPYNKTAQEIRDDLSTIIRKLENKVGEV